MSEAERTDVMYLTVGKHYKDGFGAYEVLSVEIVDPPVAGVHMRCCGAVEEDENAVDWGSATADGYLHWARAECRV